MDQHGLSFDNTYTGLPDVFFTYLDPEPVPAPKLVLLNQSLAQQMGLDFSTLTPQAQATLFSGNQLPTDTQPFAQAYAGHQFGHFTILGDGRAVMWGEHIMPDQSRLDIQFKGSGRTPYSRGGDGRAALGPMLREYVISEAMHQLGIPTTRSLAVVTTGAAVTREELLDGAILTRVASSHIRVGTFEFAARQGHEHVRALMEYTITRHYDQLIDQEDKPIALLNAVMERQTDLIVHWMRVGFIHGVMNTDNMTLSGESIDYGPCAFMDTYDPATVFSSIDHMGRYAYANQPRIGQWNIARLAETLLPLIDDDMDTAVLIAEKTVQRFAGLYQQKWVAMMRAKLGLFDTDKDDVKLISDLLDWMEKNNADFTNTFRGLAHPEGPIGDMYKKSSFREWKQRWHQRLQKNAQPLESAMDLMNKVNPAIIPRNHKVEGALQAAADGNLAPFHNLLGYLETPYEDSVAPDDYLSPAPPTERVYQTFCGT